jgi:hypothetical protein
MWGIAIGDTKSKRKFAVKKPNVKELAMLYISVTFVK